MVVATLAPQEATASSAAALVACSRTMRRRGNDPCRCRSVGRKADSAVSGLAPGVSPWMLRTRLCSCMAVRMGVYMSQFETPDAEFVVVFAG